MINVLLLTILISIIDQHNLENISLARKTKVLLIGIDGFLKNCYYSAKTSAFEYLIQNGSSSFTARTAIEALGAPGWSNILCGMNTETTGITIDSWAAPWISKKPNPITPITGNDKPFPCLFEMIKKNNKMTKTAAIFSKKWFANIDNDSIPNSIDIQHFCEGENMESSINCDKHAINIAKEIISNDFGFLFLFMGSLDRIGHEMKFCSKDYVKRISAVNDLMEDLFEYMKEENLLEDTYIIVTSDHGASFMTDRHGDQRGDNIFVPWIIKGPDVKKNHIIDSPVNNVDTAATIMKIFKLEIPDIWTSTSINDIFETNPYDELELKFKYNKSESITDDMSFQSFPPISELNFLSQ